jgi:hypothetical protein
VTTWFRHADRRFPFLWESAQQPAARWHGLGEGPAQYLSDTPDGAWAEFVRHEEITDPGDLAGVARSLWAIDVDEQAEQIGHPHLSPSRMTGGLPSYAACQEEARRLRTAGSTGLRAPSAGLRSGEARGEVVAGGQLQPGPARDAVSLVLFGARPDLVGWRCVDAGAPPERVLALARPLS